jgi:ubiquinone/menaquinone biosynthesis C-methylase UbiE
MISHGETVLDVGTGTGEVAIRIGSLVGPRGSVVAIDLQEEMLAIARRKAKAKDLHNIDFRRMSLEDMDLPNSRFDSVVGNYSLCCCVDYEGALAECLRVLKPGGRLTYNHGGPTDAAESQRIYEIFENYKPRNPSKRLKALRDSDQAQMEVVDKYRKPYVALAALRRAGFRDPEANLVPRRIRYPDVAGYVDRMLAFDWRSEVEEMKPAEVDAFRKEAIRELSSMSKGPGFSIEDETVYFTGTKAWKSS